ncbi:MAG: serine protease [Petrimonas sp.]|nr:serine protease [Christensenella sp.]MEA4949304.1 serine protease [Petrimonas sp.]
MSDTKNITPISGVNTNVVKIFMQNVTKTTLGTATGFFFNENGHKYLITNRHVVLDENENFYPQLLTLNLHNSYTDYSSNNTISVNLYTNGFPNWHEHPKYAKNYNIDVIAIEMNEKTLGPCDYSLFLHSIINFMSKDNFLQKETQISSFSDVIVVGYPLGFHDEINNLPVYRKGTIASSYPVKFNQNPFFLIDANLHPGTSGSPVLSAPNNIYINSSGSFHSGTSFILLGIQSGEYVINGVSLGLCVVWYPELIIEIINSIQ